MRVVYIVFSISLVFLISCGKDNDDIVLPEDVSNIETVIISKVVKDCITNCPKVYKYDMARLIFVAEANTKDFSNCPLSNQASFLTLGVFDFPRGLRDIPNTRVESIIDNPTIQEYFTLEYTTPTISKSIQFTRSSITVSEQVDTYFQFIISTINLLENLEETPPDTCS